MPFFLLVIFVFSSLAHSSSIEIAHEASSIRVEYYDTSKSGKVFVKGCTHCNQSIYDFKTPPTFNVDGQNISLTEFLKSPIKNRLGTIVIDQTTNTILRVNF